MECKKIIIDLVGRKHYHYISCLKIIAIVLFEKGDWEKGEKVCRECLEVGDGIKEK